MDLNLLPIKQAKYMQTKIDTPKKVSYIWCGIGTIGIIVFVIWFVCEALNQFMGV